MSDGSLGSLHRWRSQRIAKCWSCELQDTLAPFRAAEHLTHWTYISLSRLIYVFAHRLQRARLRVLFYMYVILHNIYIHTYFFLHSCFTTRARNSSIFFPVNSVTLTHTHTKDSTHPREYFLTANIHTRIYVYMTSTHIHTHTHSRLNYTCVYSYTVIVSQPCTRVRIHIRIYFFLFDARVKLAIYVYIHTHAQGTSARVRIRAKLKHISQRSAIIETNQDSLSNGEWSGKQCIRSQVILLLAFVAQPVDIIHS